MNVKFKMYNVKFEIINFTLLIVNYLAIVSTSCMFVEYLKLIKYIIGFKETKAEKILRFATAKGKVVFIISPELIKAKTTL